MANVALSLGDIADALHLQVAEPLKTVVIQSVQTDSRKVLSGDLYIAIKGEKFDGADFIESALQAGATAVITQASSSSPNVLQVADSVEALGRVANLYRKKLKARIIGITGSSGKTSTKDLLAQVLSHSGSVVAAAGSFNNEIGLPTTILSAPLDTDFLVLEMGMRGLGQITYLSEIAEPEIGILLNVGTAHIELLGSRAAIAQAKSEIVSSLPENGTAVLLADDPLVLQAKDLTRAKVLTFGEAPSADVRISDISLNNQAHPEFEMIFGNQSARVQLQLSGEHQALNAAAVTCVALTLGMSFNQIVKALESATADSAMRMQVINLPNGITVINDAYNANPESMRAGLKALKAMAKGRRTWAVLGEMRELGEYSVESHDEIGRLCVRLDINRMIGVGEAGKIIQIGAAQEGSWGNEAEWAEDIEASVSKLKNELLPGDIVYVKASRAIGLERVAEAIISHFSGENSAL
jgi:UDP-N-acetylmuramoyl-tripeptide--D-alanyl-D-alanine ligase